LVSHEKIEKDLFVLQTGQLVADMPYRVLLKATGQISRIIILSYENIIYQTTGKVKILQNRVDPLHAIKQLVIFK
jgi:hypothetical protein